MPDSPLTQEPPVASGTRQGAAGADSGEGYRQLFLGMAEGFALHEILYDGAGHAVDYRFLDVNPAFEALTGLSRERIIGHTQKEVLPDEDPYWLETYAGVVATGRPVRLEHWSPILRKHFEVYACKTGPSGFAVVFSDITERKESEAERDSTESRLRTLVEILQRPSRNLQEFLDFALQKAIELTGSEIGYIYHYSEEKREFTLNTWSRQVMPSCAIANPMTTYRLELTGIWGEAVRQRKPIVVNDYLAANPLKKGYPAGHVPLRRFMTVPVFRDGAIEGVVGLANKAGPYDERDVLQASLLMEAVWRMGEKVRAEEDNRRLLAEKEMLLKEVHHRIKNNMNAMSSILRLQAEATDEPSTAAALVEAAERINGMMILYDGLYRSADFRTLRLDGFLSDIVDGVVGDHGLGERITVRKELCDCVLDATRLQGVGIIVTELVTNAMKYAFVGRDAGTLSVSARMEGDTVRLAIRDDGVGLGPGIDVDASPGFGFTLVSALVGQLKGRLEIKRDQGTAVEISFPAR